MSYYVGFGLVLFLTLLEVSVLPLFRIQGLQPDLLLIFLITWLIIRGADEAYVLIPFGGLMLGLLDGSPFGTALLAMAPLALLQEVRGAQLKESGLVMAVIFTAIMSLLYNYIFLIVFTFQGASGNWLDATVSVILPTMFMNVAVLFPLYFAFLILNPQQRRSLYA